MRTEILQPEVLNPTQAFWQDQIMVEMEMLEWKDPRYYQIYPQPSHEYVAAYVTMVGEIYKQDFSKPLPIYQEIASTDQEIAQAGFIETDPVPSTGYDGLLGISGNALLEKIHKNGVAGHPLLIAGGIRPDSLYSTLQWLKTNNLEQTPVTFVDISPLKTDTVHRLRKLGYWDWPAGVDVLTAKIEDLPGMPDQVGKYGTIVMDIISAYAIPSVWQRAYSHLRNPFESYRKVLDAIKDVAMPKGVSLHRTLTWDGTPSPYPEDDTISDQTIAETLQSSEIESFIPASIMAQLSRQQLAVEILDRFSPCYPEVPCGLDFLLEDEGFKPHYPHIPNIEASNCMKALYQEKYGEDNIVVTRVANPQTKMFFQHFICEH